MTTIGFVGLGLIGDRRRRIVQSLGHELAFAVDSDRARIAPLEMSGVPVATTIEGLGKGLKVPDAVVVAVPHNLAAHVCIWALDQGAHVLCEKPLGISSAEARAIKGQAAARQRVVGTGFNYRYLAGIECLRGLLGSGSLGSVYRVRMMIGHGGRPGMEREWKLNRALAGGGALIDPGIHLVDLARHLFGELAVVDARLTRRFWRSNVEDNCSLALQCGETETSIDVTLTSWKNQFSIEVYGRDAMVTVTGRGGNYGPQVVELVPRWFWQGGEDPQRWDLGADDRSFELETADFLRGVSGGGWARALATVDDGVAALVAVEALYERAGRDGWPGDSHPSLPGAE